MPQAGTFGFGDVYGDLIKIEKLGAIVTNPVTFAPWQPATGTRVVPFDAGILVHTGLPNPGLSKIIKMYRKTWAASPVPVIVHLVATTPDDVERAVEMIDAEEALQAVELGLPDEITWQDAADFTRAAVGRSEKPVLVRLPLHDAVHIASAVADAGADALVIAAPPRGTARDPLSGRFIGGRVYSPAVKTMALRFVGLIARDIHDVPIIGAGGIHSPDDARDFLMAGARAVQVGAVTWVQPKMLEIIARDLGGLVLTRETGALPDEWFPGMGITDRDSRAPTEPSLSSDNPTDEA